jgi:hypothetical protein
MHLLIAALLMQQFFATNTSLGYKFALPDGFAPFPEATRGQKDLVGCWTEPVPASYSGAFVLCVQRLHGRLGRERLKPEDVPSYSQLMTFKWKGFDIDGLKTDTTDSGQPVVVLVAQVPLRREGIQLILGGPRDQASRAEALMTSMLSSLEGETNWLTDEERSSRLGTGVGAMAALLLLALLARMWRNRRVREAAAAAAAAVPRRPPSRPTGR